MRLTFALLVFCGVAPAQGAVIAVRVAQVEIPENRISAFDVLWSRRVLLARENPTVAAALWDKVIDVEDSTADRRNVRWQYASAVGLLRPLSKVASDVHVLTPADQQAFHRLLGLETKDVLNGAERGVVAASVTNLQWETKTLGGADLVDFGNVWAQRLAVHPRHQVPDFRADLSFNVDGAHWLYDRRGFLQLLAKMVTPVFAVPPGAFRRFTAIVGADVCDLDLAVEALWPTK